MKCHIINNAKWFALTASLILLTTHRSNAANSDSLFVNYGGFNKTVTVPEPAKEGNEEGSADIGPFNPVLPKTGYVLIYEPDGKTLSDILVSYTGTSLQFFSDGSPGFPTVDSLKAAQLKELGSFKEGQTGIRKNVGDLFGIGVARVRITSDGDKLPDSAGTLALLAISLLGLLGFGRNKRTATL